MHDETRVGKLMRTLQLLLLLTALIGCSPGTAQSALTPNPESARLVFDDVPRFWAAWDLARDAESDAVRAEIFQARYLSPGTPGLVSFTRERIGNPKNL